MTLISLDGGEVSPDRTLGLKWAAEGRTDLPILSRALEDSRRATGPKIEWLVDGPEGGQVTWFNWTQIFRTVFGVSHTEHASERYGGFSWEKLKQKYLAEHLTTIERTLLDGRLFRQINYYLDEETGEWYPMETRGMGGARFYLRRDPTPADHLSLRILRDCTWRDLTFPDTDGLKGEYLTELSLAVTPAK